MGRWNVYVCSERASSKMTVPTSALVAASRIVRAMSNVCARMLIAGTVNPWTSPRPRASYSAWILAERAPSACDASHTIQRAAATAGSSSLNTAVQARSAAGWLRKRASSSTTSRSPSTCAIPDSAPSRSATEVATVGMGTSPAGFGLIVARSGLPAASTEGLHHHQEDDRDDQHEQDQPALLELLHR